MINKQELKYIAIAVIFAFVIMDFVIPYLLDGKVANMSPFTQFLIFNVAIFVFLQIFLKAMVVGSKINIRQGLGILFLFMALDIIAPPLLVSTSGQLLGGPTLSGSASDYIAALGWQSIGITGFLLYTFVYVVTPFILLFLSSILLKNFVRSI